MMIMHIFSTCQEEYDDKATDHMRDMMQNRPKACAVLYYRSTDGGGETDIADA